MSTIAPASLPMKGSSLHLTPFSARAHAAGAPLWLDLSTSPAPDLGDAREAATGATVLVHVPAHPTTRWWTSHASAATAIAFIKGRLRHPGRDDWLPHLTAVLTFTPNGPDGGRPATSLAEPHREWSHADGTVADAIARYHSTLLPAETFAIAEPAMKELVTATDPANAHKARFLLSALSRFLIGPIAWDRTSRPDFSRLLNPADIDAAVMARPKLKGTSRNTMRQQLTALARCCGAAPPHVAATSPTYADRFLARAIFLPYPTTAVVSAHAQRLGASRRWPLGRTVNSLKRKSVGTARIGSTDQPTTISALAHTTLHLHHMPTSDDAPKKPRMTRKERLARTRRSDARNTALRDQALKPQVTSIDTSTYDPDIVAKCRAYVPQMPAYQDAWHTHRDLAIRLLIGVNAPTLKGVGSYGGHLARFLHWFHTWPGRPGTETNAPITYDELLAPGVTDAFGQALTDITPRSAATTRASVRRAIKSLQPPVPALDPDTTATRKAAAPYTPEELRNLIFLATNQGTHARKSILCVVIALGAGAGLTAKELCSLTPSHITTRTINDEDITFVTVPRDGRTVPVRHDLVPLLCQGLASHAARGKRDDDRLLGTQGSQRNALGDLLSNTRTAGGEPVTVQANRLRSTWLVAAMCAHVPVADLLAAAGLTTTRAIELLLPYCPAPDPATVNALLADLKDVPVGTGMETNRGGKRGC